MPSVKIINGDRVIELESGTVQVAELLEMAAQAMDRQDNVGFWSYEATSMKPVSDVGV